MANDLDRLSSTLDTVFGPNGPSAPLAPALLRLLAEGNPVALDTLAAASGLTTNDIRRILATAYDIEYDEQGRIVGYGLTLRPTPHRFEVDGHQLYTWCALDTLAYPSILDRIAHVESTCHTTGTPIRLTVGPHAVVRAEPDTVVVSIVAPDDLTKMRSAFCDHVHFFSKPLAAQAWLGEHRHASLLPVADAHRLVIGCR